MFSLQPSDELVFGTPTTSQIREDVIVDHAFMENNIIKFSTGPNNMELGRRPRERRVSHRDIERKRRQEMSSLYVSLGSLLPLKHAKGKRSVCDQIQEAVNHIEQKQKNIQELTIRRDKLKKLSGNKAASSNGSDDMCNCVTANLVPDGVEILISNTITGSDLGLSRVLVQLLERDLDVVSCISTRTKGRFLHKIQIQARDMTSFHVAMLQDNLANAIK